MENAMPPSMLNFWTTLLLMASGQGLLLFVALWRKAGPNRAALRWLAALVLVFTLTMFDYLGFWTRFHFLVTPHFSKIYPWLALCVGPLFYLYCRQSLHQLPRRWGWYFLPAGLWLLHQLPYHLLPAADKISNMRGEQALVQFFPLSPSLNFYVLSLGIMGSLFFFGGLSYRWWRRQFPTASPARAYFRLLLILYAGFTLAYLFYYLMLRTPYFSMVLDYSIALSMAVFIYTLGYLGYRQPEVFSPNWLSDLLRPAKYQSSSLTENAAHSLYQRLLDVMDADAPYLDNELRLPKLAARLDTGPHQLSQVINDRAGRSFADFVNAYRVRHAQALLRDAQHADLLIADVAYQSGFNNKTTFNKAFKAATGYSPTDYRRRYQAPIETAGG